MNLYVLSSLVTAWSSLFLGAFVLFRNPKKMVNRTFSLWTFCVFIWATGYWKLIVVPDEKEALFWVRVAHVGAIFIPVLFVHIVCTLLNLPKKKQRLLWGAYLIAAFLLVLDLTPYFISGVTSKLQFVHYTIPGPAYHFFTLFFFVCVLYGLYLMMRHYRALEPFQRNQIKYFLIASIIAFSGGTTTFLLVYNIPFPPIGVFFIPPYTFILAYAIVKHRLMDIKVVIQKGVVYILITLLVATFFMVSFILFQRFFTVTLNFKTVSYVALMSLVVALSFQPLRGLLQWGMDRLLFHKRLDTPTAFRKASESIVSVLDLQKLLDYVLEIILNTLEVELVSLYLLNNDGNGYLQVARKETQPSLGHSSRIFLPLKNALIEKLREQKGAFLREDVETQNVGLKQEELLRIMEETQCALSLPLFFRDEMVGILILGQKNSQEIFTTLDLELLSAFSNQAIVAIENAKLFNQLNVVKTYNENILRSMTSGVITVNTDYQITMVNEGAEKLLGKKAETLVNKNTQVLGGELASLVGKTLSNGVLFFGQEMELAPEENHGQVFAVSTSHLVDMQNERVGVIAVLNDITQMKELQKQVQRAEKLAIIGTMAAGLAHEIKNPLVAVKTFMDLLPTKYQDVEFRENFSQLVKQEVERINEIVTGLLDFAHPKQPVMGQVNLEELLTGTLNLLSLQAKDSRVEIVREIAAGLPALKADKEQLSRVFMNIILNGIQAMHGGGKMVVRAEKKGNEVEISFADNGPGIPPQNQQKIFDPFFSTKHKGTGLGLSICQKIIQDHKGDIRVKSSPGGTTFIVTLPFF